MTGYSKFFLDLNEAKQREPIISVQYVAQYIFMDI